MGYRQRLCVDSLKQFGVWIEFVVSIAVVFSVTMTIKAASVALADLDSLPFRTYVPYLVGGIGGSYFYLVYRNLATEHFTIRRLKLDSLKIIGSLVMGVLGLLLLGNGLTHYFLNVPLSAFTGYYINDRVPTEVVLKLLLGSVLFVAPAKEALFRGAVQGTLRATSTEGVAVVGTSVLYVGYHAYFLGFGSGIAGKILYLGILSVLSIGLGTAKEQTDNMLVPIIAASLLEALLFSFSHVQSFA